MVILEKPYVILQAAFIFLVSYECHKDRGPFCGTKPLKFYPGNIGQCRRSTDSEASNAERDRFL